MGNRVLHNSLFVSLPSLCATVHFGATQSTTIRQVRKCALSVCIVCLPDNFVHFYWDLCLFSHTFSSLSLSPSVWLFGCVTCESAAARATSFSHCMNVEYLLESMNTRNAATDEAKIVHRLPKYFGYKKVRC